MKNIYFILLFLLLNQQAFAKSFEEIVAGLENHSFIKSQLSKVKAMQEEAKQAGSWGDPNFSISAVNFPRDSFSQNESMMTGVQFGLSQKLSLSGKYQKLEESAIEGSKSHLANTNQLKREFLKTIWSLSIKKEQLVSEEIILKENLDWIQNNLKVTKRLYSTGKVPQQAVLEIQIRQSELSAQIDQNKYNQNALKHQLSVLLSSEDVIDIDLKTIPWSYLSHWKNSIDDFDYKKQELEHKLRASNLKVLAQNRNYVPDVTLGINYTKRNEIDGFGDFVGASITVPIPSSSVRYAAKSEAVFRKIESEKIYHDYIKTKPHILKEMEFEINDASNQLTILQKETLQYARSSREVTAKSYSRGGSDYLELLHSELQYQNQLIKEVNLKASLKNKKVNYLFVKGDDLKPGSKK